MNATVTLNPQLFFKRCQDIFNAVNRPVIIMLGKRVDVPEFNMNSAIFNFILGFEFSETAVLIDDGISTIYTSSKKAVILDQLVRYDRSRIRIIIKEAPTNSMFLDSLGGTYGIVDLENIRGEFCQNILQKTRVVDISDEINRLFLVKESNEIENIKSAGILCNYLMENGIDLARDNDFSIETLENCITEKHLRQYINGRVSIDIDSIEFSFPPKSINNSVRLGIRYKGYCSEIGRGYLMDLTEEYRILDLIIKEINDRINDGQATSNDVLKFISNNQFATDNISIYTIGLMSKEVEFSTNFVLKDGITFVVAINELVNTFVLLNNRVNFITKVDSASMYTTAAMRFRNKTIDTNLQNRIKEHQKELLDNLCEARIEYFSKHKLNEQSLENTNPIVYYKTDESVPRSKNIAIDYDTFHIIVPILNYSVPIHISCVKNVSLNDNRLRINLLKKNTNSPYSESANQSTPFDTFIKSITIPINDPLILTNINVLRRDFSKPKVHLEKQGKLIYKNRFNVIKDLLIKVDTKVNRKILGNLELHENGFKYGENTVLFSNIFRAFFIATNSSDTGDDIILHFNLKENQMINGKVTRNIQFVKKGMNSGNFVDCNRRENEQMEIIRQREEEEELLRHISEFERFIDAFNSTDSTLKIERVDNSRGFYGVYHKEAAFLSFTNDCLISLNESPFFVLNLNEIEVINLERVTGVTKTFDMVAVKRLDNADDTANSNPSSIKPISTKSITTFIGAIETTKLGFVKTILDSMNILFMDTKVNINWSSLMSTITKDPLNFYENGGWAELMVDDTAESSGESSSSSSLSSDESMDVSSSDEEASSDVSSSSSASESDVSTTSSFLESDTESEDKVKKVKGNRRR